MATTESASAPNQTTPSNHSTSPTPSSPSTSPTNSSPSTSRSQTTDSSINNNDSTASAPKANITPATASQNDPPQTKNGRGRRRSSRPVALARLRSAFSPSTHDVVESLSIPTDTIRPYLHRRQRWRMWRLSIGEFLITLLLSLSYFLILFLYQKDSAIDRKQRHIFNSLTTGNALLLGVNIAGSLRSYAKMFRWRILASRYRSLSDFDLILGCDSIANIFKLFWRSKWFSLTQFFCVLWITVQLGCAVAIGIIGLTYNLDISHSYINLQKGNTSVIDLSSLLSNDYLGSLSRTQAWGIRGDQTYSGSSLNKVDMLGYSYLFVLEGEEGHARYYFSDQNPTLDANGIQQVVLTNRYIDSIVSCKAFPVIEGEYGNLTYVIYDDNGQHVNQTLYSSPGLSGLYVTASTNSTCGPRCTNINTFQARSLANDYFSDNSIYIDIAVLFQCNNTVSQIQDDTVTNLDTVYDTTDIIGRMLAGMYGWSDNPLKSNNTEYQTYAAASEIGYTSTPAVTDMTTSIATFTMGGISVMDGANGLPRQYIPDGNQPIQAQMLSVKWWAAGLILGLIPFVHFCTLAIVIASANRAIIKDDSYLSIAKVYHSLLDRVGQHGCIMTGAELVQYLGSPNVVWASGNDGVTGEVRHADVYEESSKIVIQRAFEEGKYDGVGWARDLEDGDEILDQREREGLLNARAYF